MLGKILNFLRIDSADKVFKDGPERIKVHKKILLSKKLTQSVFQEFYKLMVKNMNFHFKESLSIKISATIAARSSCGRSEHKSFEIISGNIGTTRSGK